MVLDIEEVFNRNAAKLPPELQPAPIPGKMCEVEFNAGGYDWCCTRSQGHTGKHVAHGRLAQVCAVEGQ